MAGFAIGPRDEPTVILLSGHSIKMGSDAHCYTCRLVHPSTHIREVSVCSRWQLIQRPITGSFQRIRDHGVISPYGQSREQPSPQDSGIITEERVEALHE